MRIALFLGAALFFLLVVGYTMQRSRALPPGELARRCAENTPQWNGYQEDIKEIGASAVARWEGMPVSLTVAHGTARVDFQLRPPWDGWDAALPILLRTPEGVVFRDGRYERSGTACTYYFVLAEGDAVTVPPWLEIQYPHTRRRIYLGGDGVWQAQIDSAP